MTRFSSRALAGAAITVLLGSFAVVPATAAPATPVVTWVTSATTVTDAGSYAYGAVPAAPTCTAVDELAAEVPCAVTGYAVTVGTHTLTAIVADAPAGTLTYAVTATWKLKGFYGPVKEHSAWNTRKGGSTIPLKFVIRDEKSVKSKDRADIASFVAAPIPCVGQTVAVGSKTIDFLSITKKGRTLRFHDGAFHQNWKTDKVKATTVIVPAKAKGHGKDKTRKVIIPSCYQVTMTAVDGQALTALFKLK
jgi:hypothetical protein